MNLNENFIQEISKLLAASEATAMLKAIESGEPVTSVRFNSNKGFLPPASLKPVPWCEMGAYLSERPQFTFDPHFHAGSYYVQDASSMFIYHVIKSLVNKPVTYLDLCAAPGGKTTAALQALPEGSIVVANEIVTPRAQVLRGASARRIGRRDARGARHRDRRTRSEGGRGSGFHSDRRGCP